MARKTGQILGRGRHRWLVRVFLGRDRETRKRRYHSRIIRGSVRHAQTYLNKVLREHDLGRQVDGADVTLNEYLDPWLETAAKPRLREKSYRSYESLLRRYVRPSLGARNLAAICPLDIQAVYQQLVERGLSAEQARVFLENAMQNGVWPSLRGCTHHSRPAQRVPGLEVAGYQLGARHRERCPNT